ncbi:MAG: hypothetical protein RJA98_2573 [Pseudomonadota bacterium]|jgi:hypothetical protein
MTALSIRKMAEALGVSKSQVDRDAKAGMPMSDVAAARAWRHKQHDPSRTVEGRIDRPAARSTAGAALPEPSLPAAASDDDEPAQASDTDEYRKHRAERERIRKEREQLELNELLGLLINVDEAKRLAYTAFRQIRDAVLNVPARVQDQLAAETDAFRCGQLLEDQLNQALGTFSADSVVKEADEDDSDDAD